MQRLQAYSPPEPDPVEQTALALRSELSGVFQVSSVTPRSSGRVITFAGRLLSAPEAGYDEIQRRFRTHGYTPLLRRENGEDVLLAMEGVVERARTGNPLINLLLLVATVITTLSAGSQLATGRSLYEAVLGGHILSVVQSVLEGAPFAITLLGILGVHELAHYAAARWHGVRATLPYFIPLPIGLGTLGALIAIRSPMKDRKVLFDIGLAGPYAGLLVAFPLMFLGLFLSSTNYVPRYGGFLTLDTLGTSLIMDLVIDIFIDVPPGQTLAVHPIFYAAWWGIFITGLNLLPVGQLDGGHAAYAVLGRFAHTVAIVVFFLLILAGAFLSSNWYVWAFFVMFGGLRHPPPMNDIVDIGPVRKAIGFLTIIVFILIFIPIPF